MRLVPLDKKLLARVEYQFNDQELKEYRLMMEQRKAVAQGEMDRAEERNKFKCEQRLKDLKEDESRYRNEMKEQFLSCQDVEQKR